MRKVAFLMLLAEVTWHACAAQPVTVQQVEQLLAANSRQSDAALAKQLSTLELTERANSTRLANWQANAPGSHSREVLVVLADGSAFLDLPTADTLSQAPPDRAALGAIISRAINYVVKTMPRLPNFSATRATTHFEDKPQRMPSSRASLPSGVRPEVLRRTSQFSVIVTYRDGHEVDDQKAGINELKPPASLTSFGEFGPILEVVVGDAIHSKMTWAHWEQGADGPEAVFRYEVPEGKSHYRILFPYGDTFVSELPAYHGEIAVDPGSGNILRLSVVSDLKPPYQGIVTAIVVEYAPVVIGELSYICPVKSVALSKLPIAGQNVSASRYVSAGQIKTPEPVPLPLRVELNDVTFTRYHVFRSEARILTGVDGNP